MDLAFFGKDYAEPRTNHATRQGNPAEKGTVKSPNVNLLFNELVGSNRQSILSLYYQALQVFKDCQWTIPGDENGNGARPAPKYNDPATKEKIDKGFFLARG